MELRSCLKAAAQQLLSRKFSLQENRSVNHLLFIIDALKPL